MTDDQITAAQFEALCKLLFGDDHSGWQARAAGLLGVGVRNVQFWAAEPPSRCKPVPPGVARELLDEARRRLADPREAARMAGWVARHAAQAEILARATGVELSGS